MTEAELISKAQQGNEDAFAELVEVHQGKVYGLILRLTGSAEDAMELTQEAFFNAWCGLPSFHQDSKFSTWLYRLATNVTLDFFRKEKRRRSLSVSSLSVDNDDDLRVLDIPDHRFSPQSEAERRELQEAVHRGLSKLSDEHRQVLVLRELNGLSYSEIAQVLQIEEGTVKSRISRARLSLRKILLEDGNFSYIPPSIKTDD